MLDFADFDRKFELKASEASGDLIARKEQGGSVLAQLSDDCKEYLQRGGRKTHLHKIWVVVLETTCSVFSWIPIEHNYFL